jgi:hypothetical protein
VKASVDKRGSKLARPRRVLRIMQQQWTGVAVQGVWQQVGVRRQRRVSLSCRRGQVEEQRIRRICARVARLGDLSSIGI